MARLHERSGGVARVVTDLLSALRDTGRQRITPADVDAVGVPVRLGQLVLGRVAGISPARRPLVWAAAVLAEPVTADEIVEVSGLGRLAGRAALLSALSAAALVETADGRYTFAVPLAGAAVYAVVPGPVRQELHGRAADVLVRRQPVPWTSLARHHRAAGRVRAGCGRWSGPPWRPPAPAGTTRPSNCWNARWPHRRCRRRRGPGWRRSWRAARWSACGPTRPSRS
ncbi:hypothetical protein DN402_18575 [Streptomyces sp. SW4]|nr:hypothetical protein DN402_18575 [Streptomyces sp. SW4]